MHAVLGGHLDDSFASQTHAFTDSRLERRPLPLDSLVVASPREVLTTDVARGIRCPEKKRCRQVSRPNVRPFGGALGTSA